MIIAFEVHVSHRMSADRACWIHFQRTSRKTLRFVEFASFLSAHTTQAEQDGVITDFGLGALHPTTDLATA